MEAIDHGSCVTGKRVPFLTDPAQLIDEVDTFLFDVDGVIWRGGKIIQGVPETLDMLRAMGKKLLFVTNNSTKSRRMLQEKFRSLGLDISEEEVFASSFAAAGYLKSIQFPPEKKVYVVGEEGIEQELAQAGYQHLGGPKDGEKVVATGAGKKLDFDRDVGAVVVGFDHYINYYKMVYATLCIRENPGCLFIATNCDSVGNITDEQEWPAGGTMVGAIRASTAREPIVVGKPSTFMMDYLANKLRTATLSVFSRYPCFAGRLSACGQLWSATVIIWSVLTVNFTTFLGRPWPEPSGRFDRPLQNSKLISYRTTISASYDLCDRFNISKSKMCMVGDRLDTDILFGQAGGCKTLLVLSGVTDLKTLHAPENTTQPDFYTNQLPDLLAAKKGGAV
ncbi:hypothetical protein R1sor_018360 [Riccia sorocarpa]|uniref:phosphoglycolate phosphatase n=1 Tax=Riccia sorocarpa TaxID=122646 RepID=A0ABD3I9K2_9MARC